MPTKKKTTAKKTTAKKSDFEKKFNDVKKSTNKTAHKVETEGKKILTGVEVWWNNATDEEKVYMILGILLLIVGIWISWDAVKGLILIVIGMLFVTGFFVTKKK